MALREIKRYQQETNFLEEIMPTAIPTNSADLKRILNTIRLQIIYDTGMELDRLRLPLRRIEIAFDKLDLDQYLQSVEEEKSLKDRLEDEHTAFGSFQRLVRQICFDIDFKEM